MAQMTVHAGSSPSGAPRFSRRRGRGIAALTTVAALSGAFLVGSPGAQASTIDVTTTTDGGAGSLRDAISLANSTPGPDVIQVPAGTYTLSIAGRDEEANLTGDVDVTGDVTIVGAGAAGTVIDAAGIDRVLDVHAGTTTVQSVTVRGGDSGAGTTAGGGIRQLGGTLNVFDSIVRDNHTWTGGGILSTGGSLDIRRSEIVKNVAVSEPGNGSVGGGVAKTNTSGTLNISDSLIADNSSVNGNAGGLYTNSPVITVTNSTFTQNSQYTRTVLIEQYGNAAASAAFSFVTIAANVSKGSTGGIQSNVGPKSSLSLTLEGVLLQDNTTGGASRNCEVQANGAFTSLGSNLSDDDTCSALTQPTDHPNDSATTLGALAANGGPTRTKMLLAGSSALNVATCNAGVTTDQRGAPRPGGTSCDIGAFERDAIVPPSTTTTFQPSTTSTSSTSTSSTTSSSTTSTTEAPTTTTTDAPTTTTTDAPTTSTTEAPTTTTTTEAGADPSTSTSTTVAVAGESTSVVDPPSVSGAELETFATSGTTSVAGSLPVTGPAATLRLLLLAIGLLAAGLTFVLSARHLAGQRLAQHFDAQRPEGR